MISIVTGPTSGIGAETALGLARLGGTVVLVARNRARGARLASNLERAGAAAAHVVVADLSSQEQIAGAADAIARAVPQVDVLVNNAGAYFARRQTSRDGIEMNLALNHLAYFSLTLRLMGALRRSAAARVVNVSSEAHWSATIDFDDLQSERGYDRLRAYARSKLANVLFTYELARRLEGTSVTVNAVHPGAVATNLGANNGWLKVRVRNLVRGLSSPAEGARTSVYVATAPALRGVSGKYFSDCREHRTSDASYDRDVAARMWEVSEELTGLRWPEVSGAPDAACTPAPSALGHRAT
jgi:NAD(P)-dependent dehydrogenase (short-subunit alcohol dehydrogenase family)